jgi:hypothetical protein
MIYQFRADDGSMAEVEMDVADAPSIGEPLVLGGVTYKRIPSVLQVCGAHEGSTRHPRFESHQLPRHWRYHKGEFSPSGKPRFSSRKEVDEAMARCRHNDGQEISYGEL